MSKQLVLITGATGHLGFRTLVLALQAGYRARLAVRKLEQHSKKIRSTASVKPYLDSVEFVQVSDIAAAGAFDEAIKGVDYVLHIASPIPNTLDFNNVDWKRDMYDPAENGTLRVLEAAASEPKVKQVVITSSIVVLDMSIKGCGPYDLAQLPANFDKIGYSDETDVFTKYIYAKILAHSAGNKFIEQHKPQFGLVRILSAYIQGANELYESAEQMRDEAATGSNVATISTALGQPVGPNRLTAQVYLDDVARAHVEALKPSVAKSGDNLLIAGNGGVSTSWGEWVPLIKKQFPEAVAKGVISPKVEDTSALYNFDVTSSEKALGFKFAGPETMIQSVVSQYVRLAEAAA